MPFCIVAGCSSKSNKTTSCRGIILHVFPRSLDRIKRWLRQTGQDFGNLNKFAKRVLDGKKTDIFRLCSEHFTADCYVTNISKKILRDDALPTIFPNRGGLSAARSRRTRVEFGVNNASYLNAALSSNLVGTTTMKNVKFGTGSMARGHGMFASQPSNTQDSMSTSELDSADPEEPNCIPEGTSGSSDAPKAEENARRSKELASERKFIVFESCLDQILKQVSCACGEKICALHKVVQGTYLRVTGMCPRGHKSLTWENQPVRARKNQAGDVSTAGASLCIRDGSSKNDTPERCPRPLYSRDSTQEHRETSQARPLYSRDSTQEHQEIPQTRPLYSRDSTQEHQEIPQARPLYSRDSTQEHQEIPQTRPLYSRDSTQEHQEIPQASPLYSRDSSKKHQNFRDNYQTEDLNIIKVEDEEVMSMMGDESCKEEEHSPEISTDSSEDNQRDISVEEEEEDVRIKEEESPPENSTDLRDTPSDVKAEEEEEEECVKIKEEEVPIEISTGALSNRNTPESHSPPTSPKLTEEHRKSPHHHQDESPSKGDVKAEDVKVDERRKEEVPPEIGADGRYRRYDTEKHPIISPDGETEDDDITSASSEDDDIMSSSDENPTTQNLSPVLPCAKLSSDGERLPDQPHPVTHRTAGGDGETVSCSKCGKCFTHRADLVDHQRSHGVVKSFSCAECGKCFTKKRYLIEHQNIHTGENLFSCSECGKCFTRKGKLIVHQRSHTGEKPFSCPECGKCFSQKATLIKHERVHTGEKPYSCSECGKCFTGKDILITHQRIHRGEKPFTCPECGKGFRQKSDLTRHCRNHTAEKQYSCPTCGKCFPEKSLLVIHERVHTGEKPFSCSECGKCFSQRGSLISHERIHAPEKPFSCAECGKCFTQKQNLIAHQRTHTAEKPFACSECGKSFTQRVNLISHQRLHTGERPFSCSECGKSYTNRSHLATHQIVHMTDNPYSCPQCGKCFTRRGSLIQHQRSHTGEKPFSCLECGKMFTRKTSLMSHLGSHRLQEVPVSGVAAE